VPTSHTPESEPPAEPGPGPAERLPRRVVIDPEGPVLVEGPLEVDLGEGRTVTSDRFMVALCTCRRSRDYPWCDTSHRHPPHHEQPGQAQQLPDSGGQGPAQ
jgi:carboxylate-amine ligase